MGRATVKVVNTPMGGSTGINITVTSTGATGSTSQGTTTPPGQVVTGTLTDDQSGATINFAQSFGAELGLTVGAKVNYQTVTAGGQVIANVVELVHRGEITTVNSTDDGGMLLDKATKTPMPFAQQYASEMGIAVGSKVNYERIVDPVSGNLTAVALSVVNA